MSLGTLVLDLQLNGGQFTVSLNQATGALSQFVMGANRANDSIRKAEGGFGQFGKMLKDTVVTLALARDAFRTVSEATIGWQKTIIDVNADMQKSIQLMKSFSKETDPVKAAAAAMVDVNNLLNKASTSPFSLKAITDSFVKLRVSGIQPIEQGFNALIDAVAQFGGNDEALKRASVAIQQMAGKGVVSMEELRQQLGEAVPTAIQQMADGLGVTYSHLVKEISQGKVKSEPAIVAMFREMELESKGAAASMMNTWSGATAQLETSFKKLLLTIGGFNEGYGEDTYMGGMTKAVKELTSILSDPSTQAAAKEFGAGLTQVMAAAIEGIKWIIEYRGAIVELGKAFLTIYAATKAVTIIRSLGAAFMSLIPQAIGAGSAVSKSWTQMTTGIGQFGAGVSGMRTGATAATGAATALRGVLGTIGGVAGLATGPIGMLTVAVAAGAYSWWEYEKAAKAGIKAMIDSKGVGAGIAELEKMNAAVEKNQKTIDSLESDNSLANGEGKGIMGWLAKTLDTGQYIDTAGNQKTIDALKKQNSQLGDSIIQAQANLVSSTASAEFGAAKEAISDGMVTVDKEYRESKKAWQQTLVDGDKSGKSKDESFVAAAAKTKFDLEAKRMQAEYDLYSQQIDKVNKQIESKSETTKDGATIGLTTDQLAAKKKALNELMDAQGLLGDQQVALIQSAKTFADTKLDGAGNNKKAAFDGLTIFVDGLRKKLATLDAKVEETNPYLAQLEATVESLGGTHLPNFDKVLADGKALAAAAWDQEKAKNALTSANNVYKDSMERIRQIETTANNKLNKAEEKNPWESAAADAKRYEDELDQLIITMEEAKKKAADAQVGDGGSGQLQKLQEDAVKAAAAVETTRNALEKLKVSDTAKKMQEDANSIGDALMTSTDKTKAMYDRQTAWADEFYAKHKDQLNSDSVALASYNDYRNNLTAQFNRDTESGLQTWIRANKDATDQYKSLWGSAMDKFTDTIVDGLAEGKFEFSDFVTWILKEFLRIQVAKQLAAAAEATSGSSGLLGTIVSGVSSYFTGSATSGNGLAAGSAGAVSSNLGASQAGYSSAYKFANGGIMTEYGQLELNKYANGGIADRPQAAIFGEGSMAEAYVPLPDGRSIPVTVSGTGSSSTGASTGSVPVTVNIYNQSGEQQQADSTSKFDGEQMVVDIILKKVSQPGAVRDAVKTAAKG
jgi:tape measure domain-containing protein